MPVDINNLLTNASVVLSDQAKNKGIHIEIEDMINWPSNLFGDNTRIQQALLNYINNAVKFTTKGKVTVRAMNQEESLDSILVRFEVQDTGGGIPANSLQKLFTHFEQVDNSTTRKHGGT